MGQRALPLLPAGAPHALPAVSVSVSVEETSSGKNRFTNMMTCMETRSVDGNVPGVCLDGRVAASTRAPASNDALGRRHMQHATRLSCLHGGTTVTCDDKVHNGDELMTDCGGSCESRGAADVTQCASAALAMAREKVNNGTAGRFNITTPYDLTKPAGARCIMPPVPRLLWGVSRTGQKYVRCVSSASQNPALSAHCQPPL